MSDSPNPAPGSRRAAGSLRNPWRHPWKQRLDRLVRIARAALWWERAWPAIWLPLAVVILFLTASWLGLWLDLSPRDRQIGLFLFALAALASLWPALRLRWPGRSAGLDRLDRDAGPRALWELHRKRAQTAVEKLRVAAPRPGMVRRDRYAARGAALVALVGS